MTIYEVNLTINPDIADDYAAWLVEHIRQILSIDGFLSAEWFRVEPSGEAKEWTVQYRLRDRASLERYFAEHAPQMRADGVNRFGDGFSATRRIMELEQQFDADWLDNGTDIQ
jgi:antibiotic biosynthesis monooxygenase (ABM) superfamily enzyme